MDIERRGNLGIPSAGAPFAVELVGGQSWEGIAAREGKSLRISGSRGEQYGYGEADYCLDRPSPHYS